jgi:hypothetical protein
MQDFIGILQRTLVVSSYFSHSIILVPFQFFLIISLGDKGTILFVGCTATFQCEDYNGLTCQAGQCL